jgi:integrase/recombinase XerD
MLPLGTESAAWLRNYIDNARKELLKHNKGDSTTDALWINNMGKPLSGQCINVMLKQHGRNAGIKQNITVHALRRSCATHMLRNGAHPIQIQMLLGHADMSHLSHYLRLTITDIKQMHQNSNPGK